MTDARFSICTIKSNLSYHCKFGENLFKIRFEWHQIMWNVIIRHVQVVANLFTHCGQKGLKTSLSYLYPSYPMNSPVVTNCLERCPALVLSQ